MLCLACEEETRPKIKGFRVGIRYVGQLGDDTVASLDPIADFPLPLQNKRLPRPNVWQRLFDLLFSWLDDEQDKIAREADVDTCKAPLTTSAAPSPQRAHRPKRSRSSEVPLPLWRLV